MSTIEAIVAQNIEHIENDCQPQTSECQCCSCCCKRVICVSLREIEAVKKYLHEHPELNKKILNILKMVPQDVNVCPFLDLTTTSNHKCLLYGTNVRFKICQLFFCDPNSNYLKKRKKWIALVENKGGLVENFDLRYVFFDGTANWTSNIFPRSKAYRNLCE